MLCQITLFSLDPSEFNQWALALRQEYVAGSVFSPRSVAGGIVVLGAAELVEPAEPAQRDTQFVVGHCFSDAAARADGERTEGAAGGVESLWSGCGG